MTTFRVLLLAGIVAVAGWWLWTTVDRHPMSDPVWEAEANDPILVGTPADPFAYTGGDAIRPTEGTARLHLAAPDALVSLSTTILLPEDLGLILPGHDEPLTGVFDLHFLSDPEPGETEEIWREVSLHGDTGLGDPRLPETHARIAGTARLSVHDGPRTLSQGLPVIWSVAHAIRQPDGSIRQQGLTFSPLLRDKRGFSDPDRWELTLLVYDAPTDDAPAGAPIEDRPVLLQIVYRDVGSLPDPPSD